MEFRDPESVASSVIQQHRSKIPEKVTSATLDYVTMNKNAAKSSIIDAKNLSKFRAENPVCIKVPQSNSERSSQIHLPSDNNPNFTYGLPTQSGDYIGELLTTKFQQEWQKEQENRDEEKYKAELENLKKKHTRVLVVAKQQHPKKESWLDKDVSTLFKMEKFQLKEAKISCWRPSEKDVTDKKFISIPPPSTKVLVKNSRVHGVAKVKSLKSNLKQLSIKNLVGVKITFGTEKCRFRGPLNSFYCNHLPSLYNESKNIKVETTEGAVSGLEVEFEGTGYVPVDLNVKNSTQIWERVNHMSSSKDLLK
ncbi:hypothetical protein HDU92_007793 [Lobulomyces angularis]|nr:hypothetical protein HDU92_007793 [Lobulomyces angularis]